MQLLGGTPRIARDTRNICCTACQQTNKRARHLGNLKRSRHSRNPPRSLPKHQKALETSAKSPAELAKQPKSARDIREIPRATCRNTKKRSRNPRNPPRSLPITQNWMDKLQGMSDERWAIKALRWQPKGLRKRGRPPNRWMDQTCVATPIS